jgi:hypothetical protein
MMRIGVAIFSMKRPADVVITATRRGDYHAIIAGSTDDRLETGAVYSLSGLSGGKE